MNMLIPPSDPPLSTWSALGYFCFAMFLDYWGCLVRWETDFVKFWVKLDKLDGVGPVDNRPSTHKLSKFQLPSSYRL